MERMERERRLEREVSSVRWCPTHPCFPEHYENNAWTKTLLHAATLKKWKNENAKNKMKKFRKCGESRVVWLNSSAGDSWCFKHYFGDVWSSSGGSERVYLLYTAGVVFPCFVTVELVHRLVRTELRHILWHGSRNIECPSVSAKNEKWIMNKNDEKWSKTNVFKTNSTRKKEEEKKKRGPKRGFNTPLPETGPNIDFLLNCQEKS